MIHAEWEVLANRVHKWSRKNNPEEYYYCAPCVWWITALTDNIITPEEYDSAKEWYGNLWNYVGD